jgi:hypothetical protein
MYIFTVWFWIIPWSLSNSSKPWSYGMCSSCRDPKTQKRRRWLALRGCPFGGEDDQNKIFSGRTSKIWTSATCRNSSRVNCMCGSRVNVFRKILGPSQYPLEAKTQFSVVLRYFETKNLKDGGKCQQANGCKRPKKINQIATTPSSSFFFRVDKYNIYFFLKVHTGGIYFL